MRSTIAVQVSPSAMAGAEVNLWASVYDLAVAIMWSFWLHRMRFCNVQAERPR